jgi:hypothetical protein
MIAFAELASHTTAGAGTAYRRRRLGSRWMSVVFTIKRWTCGDGRVRSMVLLGFELFDLRFKVSLVVDFSLDQGLKGFELPCML